MAPVYALDYPGHGYSDIPQSRYDAAFFTRSVEGFLDIFDLHDVILAGVSIGGAIALIAAGRRNPRVARVVAINPYDYASGRGIARVFGCGMDDDGDVGHSRDWRDLHATQKLHDCEGRSPWRVANPEGIPPALLREMYEVGSRPGHYRAFISLLRHAVSWEAATSIYRRITVPVLLVWGDRDWARISEREHDRHLLPGAQIVTTDHGRHFLPLDSPREVNALIIRFAAGDRQPLTL